MKRCECDYFHDNECALVGFEACNGAADSKECADFTKDFYTEDQCVEKGK